MSARMREMAPEMCKQIDDVRKERTKAVDRHHYLNGRGKVEEAAEVLRSIEAFDAKLDSLHSVAKQKMLEGLSKSLMTDATVLQNVSKDMEMQGVQQTPSAHIAPINAMAPTNSTHTCAIAKKASASTRRRGIGRGRQGPRANRRC